MTSDRYLLGEGCYARVYDNCDGTVTKESTKAEEDGWLVWAGYCLDHQGEPHIPEIYSLDGNWRLGTYTAVMKRYDEPQTRRDDLDDWALDYIEGLLPELERRSGRWLYNDADGNWMIHPDTGQVILTDPICAHNREEGWKEAVRQEEERYRELRKEIRKLEHQLEQKKKGVLMGPFFMPGRYPSGICAFFRSFLNFFSLQIMHLRKKCYLCRFFLHFPLA